MSTKYLDLDALAPAEEISIKLKGVTHIFKEMDVSDFIWTQSKAKEFARLEGDEEAFMLSLVDMLVRSFPSCPREDFMGLGLSKLRALNDFVTKVALQGAEVATADAKESPEGKA